MTLIETQDAYVADLRRCETVTRCYGNLRIGGAVR